MSDKKNLEETVDIPESTPEDFSSQAVKKGLSPAVKFGAVIVLVFGVIGASLFLGGGEQIDPTSSIRTNADLDSTPGGVIQSESPQFQNLLIEANDEGAEAALKEKRTFIPTPENVLRPIDDLEAGVVEDPKPEPVVEPEPEVEDEEPTVPKRPVITAPPAPAPQPRPVATSQPVTTEEKENPYASAMLAQMGNLARNSNRFSDLTLKSVVRADEPEDDTDQLIADALASAAASNVSQQILIPAGDIIYGETITSANSDAPSSPVLVELTTGAYRGSSLIGKFTVNETSNRMVVEFSTMTLPDGSSVGISAFAVDGMTAETAVASDVDQRYFKRYGAILASAFITSYADAKADTGQTLTSIGDEVAIVEGVADTEQSLYAGLSAAANAIGADIARNAPDGPLVTLRDGWPLAVLFMEPVVAEN